MDRSAKTLTSRQIKVAGKFPAVPVGPESFDQPQQQLALLPLTIIIADKSENVKQNFCPTIEPATILVYAISAKKSIESFGDYEQAGSS
jgi:hypothetical protein